MKIIHRRFFSKEKVAQVTLHLVLEHSIWFEVEPMPNDEWRLYVKPEHEHLLNNL